MIWRNRATAPRKTTESNRMAKNTGTRSVRAAGAAEAVAPFVRLAIKTFTNLSCCETWVGRAGFSRRRSNPARIWCGLHADAGILLSLKCARMRLAFKGGAGCVECGVRDFHFGGASNMQKFALGISSIVCWARAKGLGNHRSPIAECLSFEITAGQCVICMMHYVIIYKCKTSSVIYF